MYVIIDFFLCEGGGTEHIVWMYAPPWILLEAGYQKIWTYAVFP